MRFHPGWLATALAAAVLATAGCGSSKPAYCSAQTNLRNEVDALGSISSPSELKASLQKIQSSATSLVNSAKSDFPSETSAIRDSVSAIESTLREAPSNPQAAIKKLPSQVQAVDTALGNFQSASKSKCS